MEKIFKQKSILFLALIIIIAAFLRFYHLASNPPSLTWDEAAWGYNAYSIGIDGKDEFGRFLPITYLESFGDFKPPMYAYLDVLPVKILGLNEFATRFPSAFFGVLTILVCYFLTKRIFKGSKNVELYAGLSSLLLAISPWHILLSRAAFEANVASFFIALGILCFLEAVQRKKWFIVGSAISFVLSMYTFNTARVFTPIIVLVLVFAFRKKLFQIKKEIIIAAVVGGLMFIPLFFFLLTPQAKLRFQEVNIFSDPGIVKTSNQKIANDDGAIWSKVINNRRVYYGLSFMNHYFDNLGPLFLFIRGDGNPKFSIQTVGQMYIWEIITLAAGVILLFRKREGEWWLIPVWLLLGIIPAATARETPHALRIETTLPTFQILSAYGLVGLYQIIAETKRRIFKIHLSTIVLYYFLIFAIFNFLYFYHDYFANYPKVYSREWQYGYKDSIDYVSQVANRYDRVYTTTSLGRPYIYYLYYMKISPDEFRKNSTVSRDPFGFVTVKRVGKFYFGSNDSRDRAKQHSVLYIMGNPDIPGNAQILKKFNSLDGSFVLAAYTL